MLLASWLLSLGKIYSEASMQVSQEYRLQACMPADAVCDVSAGTYGLYSMQLLL